MLRVVLVRMSSRFSLDIFMLDLVPRPPFDEEIWVRDFVMLGLGSYRFNSVMSNLFSIDFSFMYTCCCVQLSFLRAYQGSVNRP